jgi:hypothetical protein
MSEEAMEPFKIINLLNRAFYKSPVKEFFIWTCVEESILPLGILQKYKATSSS